MRWLINWLAPPLRYWLIWNNPKERFMVVRQRIQPSSGGLQYNHLESIFIDGPFESQEDAAHALAFWRHQYPNGKLSAHT